MESPAEANSQYQPLMKELLAVWGDNGSGHGQNNGLLQQKKCSVSSQLLVLSIYSAP